MRNKITMEMSICQAENGFSLDELVKKLADAFENKAFAVFLAEPVADLLAVCTTAFLFRRQFKVAMEHLKKPLYSPLLYFQVIHFLPVNPRLLLPNLPHSLLYSLLTSIQT